MTEAPSDLSPQEFAAAERLARRFHETYERLAPQHGWETQEVSRTDWDAVPESNKRLMIATAHEILSAYPQLAVSPLEDSPS